MIANHIIEARATYGRHVPGGGVIARGSALRHFFNLRRGGQICLKNFSMGSAISARARVVSQITAIAEVGGQLSARASVVSCK